MSNTPPNTSQDTNVSWHVVAFLDLLGQQDKLRQITALPDQNNSAEVEAFKRAVMELYSPVASLRAFFLNSIKSFTTSKEIENPKGFPEDLLREFRGCPIGSQTFSDCVIAHVPIRNDVSVYPCRAIYGVFCAAAFAFLSCLARAHPIRGGIDLGLAFNIDSEEIYGPALARAYSLESKVANYPRIVIGEELVRYLNAVASSKGTSIEEQVNATTAQSCLDMLTQDDDGHAILDYLGNELREQLIELPTTVVVIQQAYGFVLSESQKHQSAKNSKLGFRYTLLRNYFEARLPEWGFELQPEVPQE